MKQEYLITQEGLQKLKEELEDMKTRQREDLSKRLRFAIQQGDLSENADYHKAKEDQAFLEGKIREYEETIAGAKVIGSSNNKGIIDVGSHITIKEGNYPEERYQMNPRSAKHSSGIKLETLSS